MRCLDNGCYSHAIVFATQKALALATYFDGRKTGFMDVLTEGYANEKGKLRLAIMPSVVQHIRRRSSKGPILMQKTWTFELKNSDGR
jgi:hypothetical protein